MVTAFRRTREVLRTDRFRASAWTLSAAVGVLVAWLIWCGSARVMAHIGAAPHRAPRATAPSDTASAAAGAPRAGSTARPAAAPVSPARLFLGAAGVGREGR
jgi:hypothetical protein